MCFLFFLEIGYTSTSRNVEQQLRDQELVIQEMVQVQKNPVPLKHAGFTSPLRDWLFVTSSRCDEDAQVSPCTEMQTSLPRCTKVMG